MKILVTGSSGLLGGHVAAELVEAGHEVTGVDRIAPAEASWSHVTADVADLGVMAQLAGGMEALVHIAAIPRPTGRAAADVFRINMAAVYAVTEAARIAGVSRLVYASSFSVLGYPFFEAPLSPPFFPVNETHPVGAQDVYAVTKWLGEELIEACVRRGAFDAVSLRMPWVQTPETFAPQITPRLASGEAWRDLWAYIDSRDAAAAFVAAIERPLAGHHRLFVSAVDSFSPEPTADLVAGSWPGVPFQDGCAAHASLINCEAARDLLDYSPRHSWRAYPAV